MLIVVVDVFDFVEILPHIHFKYWTFSLWILDKQSVWAIDEFLDEISQHINSIWLENTRDLISFWNFYLLLLMFGMHQLLFNL